MINKIKKLKKDIEMLCNELESMENIKTDEIVELEDLSVVLRQSKTRVDDIVIKAKEGNSDYDYTTIIN